MTSERAQIQAFLGDYSCDTLPEIRKAGIVPFMRAPMRYYVMTPIAAKPELGLPEFQLCKGTRMYHHEGTWRDMKGAVPEGVELEALPATALREGMEELGLKLSNIAMLHALGEYRFTSATSRTEITLWMLAAEMKNANDFTTPHASTASCAWMTLAEFQKQGRPDHAHILGLIESALCK